MTIKKYARLLVCHETILCAFVLTQKHQKVKTSFSSLDLYKRFITTATRAAAPAKGRQACLLLLHPTLFTFLQILREQKQVDSLGFKNGFLFFNLFLKGHSKRSYSNRCKSLVRLGSSEFMRRSPNRT